MQLAICDAKSRGVTDMIAIHDVVGWLACNMDAIAEAVRVGFARTHEARPLQRFREAVLMALPNDGAREKLRPLPARVAFDVRRSLGSGCFLC